MAEQVSKSMLFDMAYQTAAESTEAFVLVLWPAHSSLPYPIDTKNHSRTSNELSNLYPFDHQHPWEYSILQRIHIQRIDNLRQGLEVLLQQSLPLAGIFWHDPPLMDSANAQEDQQLLQVWRILGLAATETQCVRAMTTHSRARLHAPDVQDYQLITVSSNDASAPMWSLQPRRGLGGTYSCRVQLGPDQEEYLVVKQDFSES